MAETKQHYPPGWHPVDGIPEEPPDWPSIDRLIILMGLVITKRLLQKRQGKMSERVRRLVIGRMDVLIKFYRRPPRS